ncbi:MAG: hypothetical protein ACFFD4_11410 [Candidatus Odinarchaeota archaeon]
MSEKEKESLVLRVDLDHQLAKTFFRLKEERNLRTNAEAIRYCITEVFERKEITLPKELAEEIDRLLQGPLVLQKYQIYDQQEFIIRALESYILRIRKEIGTLFTWSVRQKLNDDENAVAVALIELQPVSHPNGVFITQIIQKTGLSLELVQKVLENFVDQGLVYKYNRKDDVYYYAPSPEDYES